jgi:hypothetical protein
VAPGSHLLLDCVEHGLCVVEPDCLDGHIRAVHLREDLPQLGVNLGGGVVDGLRATGKAGVTKEGA